MSKISHVLINVRINGWPDIRPGYPVELVQFIEQEAFDEFYERHVGIVLREAEVL